MLSTSSKKWRKQVIFNTPAFDRQSDSLKQVSNYSQNNTDNLYPSCIFHKHRQTHCVSSCLCFFLCCLQTSLPLAALQLWWWYLHNCTNATSRRAMTQQNWLPLIAHSNRSWAVDVHSTREQHRTVMNPSFQCCRALTMKLLVALGSFILHRNCVAALHPTAHKLRCHCTTTSP